MLKGMDGASLGIWCAHGEGRVRFPDPGVRDRVLDAGLAPLRYADDEGAPTEEYPMNPNGSEDGIAALVSEDGRHLAMMPHPERCFLTWQLPDSTPAERVANRAAPWLKMFQNAREWCAGSDT